MTRLTRVRARSRVLLVERWNRIVTGALNACEHRCRRPGRATGPRHRHRAAATTRARVNRQQLERRNRELGRYRAVDDITVGVATRRLSRPRTKRSIGWQQRLKLGSAARCITADLNLDRATLRRQLSDGGSRLRDGTGSDVDLDERAGRHGERQRHVVNGHGRGTGENDERGDPTAHNGLESSHVFEHRRLNRGCRRRPPESSRGDARIVAAERDVFKHRASWRHYFRTCPASGTSCDDASGVRGCTTTDRGGAVPHRGR